MNYRDREEQWLDIPGFEGLCQASTEGRIRSVPRVVMRSNGAPQSIRGGPTKERTHKGYKYVTLARAGKMLTFTVHRLVALAFHGERPDGNHVAHRDGDKGNNRPGNLRYATPLENEADKRFCPRCGMDVRCAA